MNSEVERCLLVEVGWNKFTEEEEFRISREERGEEKIITGKVERQE